MNLANKIFVSLPYTGTPQQIQHRVDQARQYCAALLKQGYAPVCPVIIGHDLQVVDPTITKTHEQWLEFALAYFDGIAHVHVLQLDGWDKSQGVNSEVECAQALDINIEFIHELMI